MDQSRRFVIPGQNRLLGALSREMQLRLLPRMEKLSVPVRQVLHEAQGPIVHVYFPLSGAFSLAIFLKDGRSVEVGTVGNEGMLGVQAFLGAEHSATRACCQVAGQALKMRLDQFRRSLEQDADFAVVVRRYLRGMINQIAQSAACYHVHSVRQRICRALLMTHDRVGADEFQLTQEFLARMLCVRRPSVTVAAGLLQKAGSIRYQRGRIRILDRAALEQNACECYESLRQELDRLLQSVPA